MNKRILAILIAVILALAVLMIVLFIIGFLKTGTDSPQTPYQQQGSQDNTSDPVKSTGQSNGDTRPSSNGIGPGSNNSLLGP